MTEQICGHCTNWRCDDPLHLKGHCIINRMDRFHETMYDNCTKFQIRWTDKLSIKSNGDIIDFEGRIVGHIDLRQRNSAK